MAMDKDFSQCGEYIRGSIQFVLFACVKSTNFEDKEMPRV